MNNNCEKGRTINCHNGSLCTSTAAVFLLLQLRVAMPRSRFDLCLCIKDSKLCVHFSSDQLLFFQPVIFCPHQEGGLLFGSGGVGGGNVVNCKSIEK